MDNSQTNINTLKNNATNFIKKNIVEIEQKHLIVFVIVILLLQYVSIYLEKNFNLTLFRIPLVTGAYLFLATDITAYQYLKDAIICTVIAYLIFIFCNKRFSDVIVTTATIFAVTFAMFYSSNAISVPSIAYAISGVKLIPKLGYNFILYYLYAVAFVIAVIYILRYLSKKFVLPIDSAFDKAVKNTTK
jgi:hypothetical protein